jgi:hypothetical protein
MSENENRFKPKKTWVQYLTLAMATLAMVFSLITAFHPFGLGVSSTTNNLPNFSQQNNGGMPSGGMPGGSNNSITSDSDSTTNSSSNSTTTSNT